MFDSPFKGIKVCSRYLMVMTVPGAAGCLDSREKPSIWEPASWQGNQQMAEDIMIVQCPIKVKNITGKMICEQIRLDMVEVTVGSVESEASFDEFELRQLLEQLSAASSRVVELEEELQMAANDSAKVPYSSIFIDFPWSKATESIWKWYFSIIFLEFSIHVSLQAVAQVDQLLQEMDLWPHLANIFLVWHSLCFRHVTYIACPLRILTCICCQCVCVCVRA